MTYDPRRNLACLALQLAVQVGGLPPDDCHWAVRAELDDDGSCHLLPLYPADVPAYVSANWEMLQFTPGWSMPPS